MDSLPQPLPAQAAFSRAGGPNPLGFASTPGWLGEAYVFPEKSVLIKEAQLEKNLGLTDKSGFSTDSLKKD